MANGSRLLAAVIPGGLLSSVQGMLTAGQQLVVQSITNGTYFYINVIPTGLKNGSNQTYGLPAVAKPLISVEVRYNGTLQTYNVDYTVAADGLSFTFTTSSTPGSSNIVPIPTDTIVSNFLSSPV